uniref:LPD23 domain-containing protein n=1 Tax=Dysosmobacter welbionis TaxID=2093857 RepID=UPI003FEFDAB4
MPSNLEKLRERVYGSANPTKEQVQVVRNRASTLSSAAPSWAQPKGRVASPSLPTASGALRKAGRPTTAGKPGKITSPAREAERRAEELRTLRDEAQQEFLNFRGAEITAGAAGMPTEPYTGQRYRTAEEAYRARQDYDRQLAELRNRYYQEENEQQRARLAEDASMQASFARADEIRGALNRIQTLEQTRAAAPGPVTEDAVNQAVREIAGQYGLSREDSRNLTTVRKALEAQLLEETDRISAAGYDYERMTEYQKRQERAAEAERQRQQTEAWADEHPVLASLASVGASALQAVDIPRLIATGGGSEDDLRTYTPADPNAAIISNFVTGVRDTVSKKIVDNTDWELFGQNVASFLYNTGMSIGDSASQVALLGPWATYLMGASAASQQAVNVLERGGSNSQAFWGGLAAGAAEAVFERFSIEKLLEAKTINSVKDLLRATARQAGTEASEEMLTEIANILSDTAIMGESSDFEQLVTQYQLMGMDEDEARKQAYLDSVAQVVWAGVGGALSGMAMGGGLGGVDLAGRNIRQRQQQTTSRAIDAAYDTMQREGLFSPAARQATEQAQQRIDAADRREARAYNNNYMGRPQRQASRDSQAQQDEQGQAQGPQNTQAAVNVEELEQSAAAAGVAEADVRAAAEISRATGREIRFYDGTQRQDPSGRANGYFDGDTIYVNSRSANPVAQIISHELTHSVEMADAYRDLSSLVFDRIQKTGGDLERLRQEKQAFYAQNGKLLRSQKEVDQEIVAEYVEHNLLTSEQEILELTREKPTLAQRIMDWIDQLLAKLGNSSARERDFLTTARNTYARALEQTRTTQEAGRSAQQTAAPAAQAAPAGQQTERQTEPQAREQETAPKQQTDSAAEEEKQRSREEIRQEIRALREDLSAGRISDEEFDEALDTIMEEEGLEDISMLNRYSFGGENARRADLEALDRAQDMERRGVAMETIFQETGWYTGADGKWRFEIDDSGMEYSRWGDMNRSDRAEYARFRELEGRFIDGTITQEEQTELRSLLEEGHGPGRAEEQQTLRLSDFVRHDELYQNYPQLRRAGLRFADLPDGTYGTYNTETNTITLDNSLRSSPEDTLVHEIQHAIQNAEGFAGGSSPEYWRTPREAAIRPEYRGRIQETRERLREIEDRFRQEWPNDTINLENARAYYAWDDLYWKEESQEGQQRYLDRMNTIEEAAREGGWEDLLNEYYAARAERDAAISAGMDARRTPYDTYFNTAGEIEARDAAQRRQMTPEQRRETMPNTGDENTVFADNFGNSFSAEAAEPVDSQAFKDWFGDWTSDRADHSQVVDGQGRPLIVYHGTGTSIEEFLPEFTGQGNDQYGSGFYFTTDRETAEGYTTRTLNDQSKPGGMDNPNVIPAYLNIRNPLVVEARDTPNLYQIEVPASQAAKIIGKMPDIMDPENSILGDFFDDYWESGPKRSMINRLAREYDWTLGTLATDIFRDHPTEYRQAVRDVLGYDGVQVNFPSGEKHFIAWFPNQIKHATENSGAFSPNDNRIRYSISEPTDAQQHPQGARRIRKTAEPSTAAQDEADRLFFQGVDADTIREETGLERTEDHGWRFAVDTAQAAAYDGGRTTDQQGGADNGQDTTLRGIYGEDVRGRETEETNPGRLGSAQRRNAASSQTDEGRGRTAPASWARGRVIDQPSIAAGIAVENAGRYGADAFVVEDAAIKEKNPNAWALTSGGSVYISDSVPEELAGVVGYHEAVHAARQQGQAQYRDFLENTGDYIDFTSNQSAEIMDMILGRRFPGRESLLDLTQREQDIAFDELNAVVWGFHKADQENAREQFADMFQDYDAYIADLDAAMESGAEPEIPGLSLPTLDDEDIRYSMDEDSAAAPDDSANQTEQSREESAVAALPPRAQNYLKSVERKLLRKMGNSLSVPRWARREFLAPIVRDISEAYLVEGRVPAETMDNLFDEAYEQGVVAAREYYDEYKELRDYLRNTKLEVSQEDAAGIPDFNDFRKSNFGRLNISTKSGKTNVDQVYQELSARWPEFFNEDRENNIPDQLERIAEVSKSFRIVEQTLDEYYGDRAADFRQYAKHDFEAAVTDLLGELRNVKRYADASRQPAEAADQAPATLEEVNALWTDLKEARRTYEKAEARNLLTDSDEAQVGRLLRGEIEPRHLNPERDNVRGITEVYQAKREYERITGLLRLWNQSRKAEMRTQAEHLLETANAWKDKKSGILYARETMERNIRDIVPDRQLAEQIIETYFKPVHRAAADSNRLKNRYRDQVRGMHLSRKVAKGNTVSEAHAVQLLGEAEDNIRMIQQSRGRRKVRDGKTLEEWQAVIRDLWETSPHLDQGKIRNAVQTFRTIYDELFQQMNDARVRNGYEPVNYRQGYFPHFQPGDGDGILATFGRALGISTEVTALPTTINGLTHAFRPGIQWFGNAQERLGFNTAYDAVEGFDRYIEGVADVIYQTDNIQRLRTLATEIRYRTGDEEIRRQIDRVRDDPGKNDEEKRKAIEEITEKGRFALSNFVVELDEYTNLLANKKSFSDRNMERNVGRTRLYNLARWLEGRVAANMVAVNPASWLTNFIPLTQGGALLDRGMLLRGMWDTLWSYKESDGIAERSSFLVNRRGSDPLVQTWGQKASVVMSRPMSYIDTFTADSLVRARYRQNLKRGMSEDAAMADADAFAANVMADRSKGATPTLFNRRNPMTKLFTQFQLEVNNQLSYVFKDIPREKRRAGLGALAAALFKFVLGAWLYDEVYEFLIGRRPALDPIGILNDTVGDLTGWEVPNLVELGVGAVIGDAPSWQVEEAGLYETAGNLGTALAEELPFIGGLLGGGRLPIGSAIPDFGTLRRAAMDNEWAPEKRLKEAADELAKPAAYLALPFGGGQIKRVFEAIDAVRRGGVYTLDAEGEEQLQYPVYNDTFWEAVANGLRAAVFGRTSLPTGREWVESGFDTLSAKQTAAYKGMVDVGVPGEEAYSLVQELQGLKAAEQRKTLRSADISGDGKSVVYYAMMASDDEMALMDALAGQNADMGEVTRVLMEMKDEARKEENKRSTVDILSGASLTDGQKAEIFRSTGSDSLEEKLSVAEEYGISGGEWMEAEEGFAQEREEAEAKSLTQEIAEAVIRNMDGLDRQERAAMWQLQNKGWNWKSNPFDRKVGREIYDQQHAEDED